MPKDETDEKATEREKARGQAPSQQQLKAYHEGDFQTTDPVTGKPRGKLMNWQDENNPNPPIGEELSPEDLKAQQQVELKRSADAGPTATPARKSPAAKKATKTAAATTARRPKKGR